ncbi:hypothetical protein [Curtobacterium poinsettiae]|uniref:hypothetical protein n=1 Tax=Curtobacterium poinsettiae TaxID=159612 RepID=UPI0023601C90|nr:hypothetical protein [Curtobacterium flaccumfaciens]MDD1386824.1 hypothetical protein [Curtobacterium flaccumfaciens pv. poinsettiae]
MASNIPLVFSNLDHIEQRLERFRLATSADQYAAYAELHRRCATFTSPSVAAVAATVASVIVATGAVVASVAIAAAQYQVTQAQRFDTLAITALTNKNRSNVGTQATNDASALFDAARVHLEPVSVLLAIVSLLGATWLACALVRSHRRGIAVAWLALYEPLITEARNHRMRSEGTRKPRHDNGRTTLSMCRFTERRSRSGKS